MAWLNSHTVKKKGVTVKEKERTGDVGLAVNASWRWCLEWWEKLDARTRKWVFEMVLGESAKSLTDEILNGASSALEDDRWLFSLGERPSTSTISFPRKIAALSADPEFCFPLIQPSVSKNFLLHCANSSISWNTKSPSTQSKGKLCTSNHKKKGEVGNLKKQPVLKLHGRNSTSDEPAKDHGCELAHTALVEHSEPAKISDTSEQMDLTGETSLSSEQAPRLVDGKVQTVVKKRKKGRSKKNNCGITVAPEVQASERVSMSHYATGRYDADLEHIQHVDEMIKHQDTAMQGESVICMVDSDGLTTSVLVMEINKALQEKDMNRQELGNTCKGWPSYEWPSMGPTHFQSVNGQHLPAATDRREIPQLRVVLDRSCLNHYKPSFQQGFTAQNVQLDATFNEAERKNSGNLVDLSDHLTTLQDLADQSESLWVSEEEFEVHPVCGMDYNQYFGGGVISDDGSWAWHEAEMSRAVDDMVAFSSSYNTNGLTSPPATPFCSPFDPLLSGRQALGLWKTGDSLPCPILRPIIVPSSRSDFKHGHDHKSPCVPPARFEHPGIKRPPSPLMLCVPWAPHPPPPSPVGDSRKHRGFPTVRSGSSSPRHWGLRGWFHVESNLEEACFYMDGSEVV
ncbi:hypothetical protein RJ641_016223 [Dillenia turbinata]|uniref:Uncharacterized protein n=1 Tax=Dillenia turbinata TaxID=194707 RepID=A0AAN8UTG5_9MAGN